MKLATIEHNGQEALGLISEGDVLDLTAAWTVVAEIGRAHV